MYDATTKIESTKIPNLIPTRSIEVPAANAAAPANAAQHVDGEYQLFVNRREEICVMQSSADVDCGRYIKVSSVTRIGKLQPFGLLFKAFGDHYLHFFLHFGLLSGLLCKSHLKLKSLPYGKCGLREAALGQFLYFQSWPLML